MKSFFLTFFLALSVCFAYAQGNYVSSPIVKAMESGKYYMKLGSVQSVSDPDIQTDEIKMSIEIASRGGVSMSRTHMQMMDGITLTTDKATYLLDETAKTWTARPVGSTSFDNLEFVRQGRCRVNGQDGWYFDEYTAAGATITFYYNSDLVSIIDMGSIGGEDLGPMSLLSFSTYIPSNMYFCVGDDWKEGTSGGGMGAAAGMSMDDALAMAGMDRAALEAQIRESLEGEELPEGMSIDDVVNMALGALGGSAGKNGARAGSGVTAAPTGLLPAPPKCTKPWTDSGTPDELACGNNLANISITDRQGVSSPVLASSLPPATPKKKLRIDREITQEGVKLALTRFLAQCKGKSAEQIERNVIQYADSLGWALFTGAITGELAESAIARCSVYPHPTMLNTTGTMLLELGEPKYALEYFEKSAEYQPDYADALYGQIECHLDMGNEEQARKIVPKILEMTPNGLQDGRVWLYQALLEKKKDSPFKAADYLFKSISLGYFDQNSALMLNSLLTELDAAEMAAAERDGDFLNLVESVFTEENLENIRKGITWSRTEKFESEKGDFTATGAGNLESNRGLNHNYDEQYTRKGESAWRKSQAAMDASPAIGLIMAMGLDGMAENADRIYETARELPSVKGNARGRAAAAKLKLPAAVRSFTQNGYAKTTSALGMRYGVDGFYVPDDRAFWCLWALERYYKYRLDAVTNTFGGYDEETNTFHGVLSSGWKSWISADVATGKKYNDMYLSMQKRHEAKAKAQGEKCQKEWDAWIEAHPDASDSLWARAERRIFRPFHLLVGVTQPLEVLDNITAPQATEEQGHYMDYYNSTVRPILAEWWADVSKYALYCLDPNVAKYFWFRTLSDIYGEYSGTFFSKALAGESLYDTRQRILKLEAQLKNEAWRDANAAANDYYQQIFDARDEKEFPKNAIGGLSDFTFDINLPSGTIRIGLVDGQLGMDLDTETKFWEKAWADYESQMTGQPVKATGTDNAAVKGFIDNVMGQLGAGVSWTDALEQILDYSGYGELGKALKIAGPLDLAMKARQGKLIETTDSQRHGGWVRDGAGNLHQRNITSRSTDFNGVFKLTDEIHQAGNTKQRKLMATYNSGGLFSVSAGGFSPKHR
jgi:tetratricopeptide (TPR) repeat protein